MRPCRHRPAGHGARLRWCRFPYQAVSDAVLGTWEAPILDSLDVGDDGGFDGRAADHEVAHKARRLAGVEHVVKHQYLAGALGPGADAYCRYSEFAGKFLRKRGRNHLEYQECDPCGNKCTRVLEELPRRSVRLALCLVSPEAIDRSRLQTDVPAYGNAPRDEELDL